MTMQAYNLGLKHGAEAALAAEREAPLAYANPDDVPTDAAEQALRALLVQGRTAWLDALLAEMGCTACRTEHGVPAEGSAALEGWGYAYAQGCVDAVVDRLRLWTGAYCEDPTCGAPAEDGVPVVVVPHAVRWERRDHSLPYPLNGAVRLWLCPCCAEQTINTNTNWATVAR